ncbi:MAG: hemerythrin domain-containing protein [Pyrinomonadaceae bacterium]
MKATQVLMVDHEEVYTMLNTLLSGAMDATDAGLFGRLREALKIHTAAEEQIFYPALENFEETKELISESYTEHKAVDELLASMTPGDENWDDKISQLNQMVKHHAEEEEERLFPQAERLLGEDELNAMGQKIIGLKAEKPATTVAATKFS